MTLTELSKYLNTLKNELSGINTTLITESLNNRLESSFDNYRKRLEQNYNYILHKGNVDAIKTLIAIAKYEKQEKERRKKQKGDDIDEQID